MLVGVPALLLLAMPRCPAGKRAGRQADRQVGMQANELVCRQALRGCSLPEKGCILIWVAKVVQSQC